MGMGSRGLLGLVLIPMWLVFLCLPETGLASVQNVGKLNLGFRGSQMTWIDNNGMILLSNNSNFGFGFNPTQNVTLFVLVVMHLSSQTVIWSANRGSPVQNSDLFVFDDSGNAYLQSQGSTIWSSGTGKKGVAAMELRDSGNLVLVGNDSNVVWQSFDHPVDTLVSNQEFDEGMKLVSSPGSNNFTYSLEIKSGDMILSASFNPPQPYWALGKDSRTTINKLGGGVTSAVLEVNSWKFYDRDKVLIWQFIFSGNTDVNATWIAVLGNNGVITFSILQDSNQPIVSTTRIPEGECNTPAACDPYYVCHTGNMCQCPSSLPSSCKLGTVSLCNNSEAVELVDAGNSLSYFAIGFVPPASKTNLNGCKNLCLGNCTCAALFFDSSSGNCFLFDQIGSLRDDANGAGFSSYIKVLSSSRNGGDGGSSKKHVPIIIAIAILTILIIAGLVFVGIHFHKKRNENLLESPLDSSEEDNFLEGLSGMPIRFSYKDLQNATNDFSVKLGHGGFGSVYQGVLGDGTRVAVKKLEGIGQGKKEFRAEVSIIGRIHHLHLARLKGFCAEGAYKLLVYEYMANGSLDRWLFRDNEGFMLDWNARYTIALGTAKGLAYLHEDCDAKIVHCDIKPENVLLDDHFLAKVSDFGLAKLMTREQSQVFTTLRGTRGYLAPEWITNYAISEKSDVYSYGMVLLEIIGGRKNYDSSQSSEKSHFPSYAFKMNEEGKLKDIVDMKLKIDEGDERALTAIRVALWCIQDDMHLRPPMTKVVQMLEGLCPVPPPPSSSPLGSRLYSSFFKSASEECTSSGASAPSDYNSDAYLSAVRLSGPSPPLEMRSAAVVHRPVLGSTAAISPSLPRSSKFRAKTLPAAKFGGKSIRAHSASASASSSPSTASLTSHENHCRGSYMLGRRALLYMATLSFLPCNDFDERVCAAPADETFLVREEIGKVLSKVKAPGVLRLVFHDAGTFEMEEKTGGMNGSIIYELDRPENKGLKKSVKILEKAKSQLDGVQPVSWADIIAVAGAEAVSLCGGPKIPIQLGRIDSLVPDPEGKLPEESLDASAMKQCFQRKGFSTQELVALSGAHTIGGKGFGNPTVFDNSYFKILIEKPWLSSDGMSSMIGLPSDRALVEDDECVRWISKYANDQSLFFDDFKNVYLKLVNTGATWRGSV